MKTTKNSNGKPSEMLASKQKHSEDYVEIQVTRTETAFRRFNSTEITHKASVKLNFLSIVSHLFRSQIRDMKI